MNVFITGIAGFIGFYAAIKFHKQGYTVNGCDNFNDYYDPALKRHREHILSACGIRVGNYDIQDGIDEHIGHYGGQNPDLKDGI